MVMKLVDTCDGRCMDKTSLILGIAALIASIAALVTSSLLVIRQIRAAHGANQLPVVFDIFHFMQSSEVWRKEELVKAELPNHDPDLGFSGLPEPLRSYAHEVSSNYNKVGYLIMLRVVDERIAILPLHYRARAIWAVVHQFVGGERELRNDRNSFMNGLECLIARMERTDIPAMMVKAERLIRS
jgi:hypothetical protein